MTKVQVDEAQRKLLDLIHAAIRGEQVLIIADDQQAVRLVPVESLKRHPKFGSAKGLIEMAQDFDAPLDDFSEYMP